jgi:hypothetical protein
VRPILGWHLTPIDIILNPIVDTAYDGFKNLDFAPAIRVAYNISEVWAVAAEEYADYGPLHDFLPKNQQVHQLYAVVDRASKILEFEFGVGFGLTPREQPADAEAHAHPRSQQTASAQPLISSSLT